MSSISIFALHKECCVTAKTYLIDESIWIAKSQVTIFPYFSQTMVTLTKFVVNDLLGSVLSCVLSDTYCINLCHSGNSKLLPFLLSSVVVPIRTTPSGTSNWNYN